MTVNQTKKLALRYQVRKATETGTTSTSQWGVDTKKIITKIVK